MEKISYVKNIFEERHLPRPHLMLRWIHPGNMLVPYFENDTSFNSQMKIKLI